MLSVLLINNTEMLMYSSPFAIYTQMKQPHLDVSSVVIVSDGRKGTGSIKGKDRDEEMYLNFKSYSV